MKKTLIASAAALGFVLAATTASHAQTVRIATEGAYAPWNYINAAGEPEGFEIALGNEICARAGLTCEWVVTAWDTMIPNLIAQNYDVIMAGMSITEERLQSIDFSEEYYPPEPSRFALRAGTAVNFDAMTGLRIGAQSGTIQADYAAQNFATGNTLLTYETFDQAIADLAAGNVDMVLADLGYVAPIVTASNGALVLDGPQVPIGGGVGAGMRKDDDDLEAAFNGALESMKADGSLNALITEWFETPNLFD